MTSTQITPAQSAVRHGKWTAAEWAAYEVGRCTMNAWQLGYAHGADEQSPYGDLSGPDLGGLAVVLHLTGPGRPRMNAAYRAMVAESYRAGRRAGLEDVAAPWTEADDDDLAGLAELGYDDEATSQ